jgi:hypothetical protein|tara:strand:- start:192 stop:365 length:174 start_codon:yes stop_codon:yes gene_type:complete
MKKLLDDLIKDKIFSVFKYHENFEKVLKEFKSFVHCNPDRDMGSIILARIDGMPLLE